MQRLTLSILLLLSLFSGPSVASTVQLSTSSSGSVLNGQIELLEDVDGQLSIADMADAAVQSRFQPAAGRTSVGQSSNPWWIKLSLKRASDAPEQWWLEVGAVTLLDLQIFLPSTTGQWQLRQAGERVGFAEGRDHDYRRAVFRLPVLDEQPQTIYLRTYDPAGNSFPLRIWQLHDLEQLAKREHLVLGLIYGVILALLLYNLFILLALRDPTYLWYVLTMAVMVFSTSGRTAQYRLGWTASPCPFWLASASCVLPRRCYPPAPPCALPITSSTAVSPCTCWPWRSTWPVIAVKRAY